MMVEWKEILDVIKKKISKPSFETWLKHTDAFVEDGVINVITNNKFAQDWIQERYNKTILDAAFEVTGQSFELRVTHNETGNIREEAEAAEEVRPAINLTEMILEQQDLLRKQQEKIDQLEQRIEELEKRLLERI